MVTADRDEVEKFDAIADEWWDPSGKFAALHLLNPCRLDYINRQIEIEFGRTLGSARPFEGLNVLDVGCGGGLLAEPLARLGSSVVGIDAAERSIAVARRHAEVSGLEITYRHDNAEALLNEGRQFDVVLAMEVIEHVSDPQSFVHVCAGLLKTGGLLICSTINRTTKSFALAIVGAEYVMRWLPRGTHDWQRFVKPTELLEQFGTAGLHPLDCKGFVFNPFDWDWKLSDRDTSVNYVACATRSRP